MALLWMDSMDMNDNNATILTDKGYTSGGTIIYGRNYNRYGRHMGLGPFNDDHWWQKDIGSNETTLYFGLSYKHNEGGSPSYNSVWPMIRVLDESLNHQIRVHLTAGNELVVYNGHNALLGTTATGGIMFPNYEYHHIEVKCVVHDSAGVVEIHYDGAEVLNLTGQDTLFGDGNIRNIRVHALYNNQWVNTSDFWVDDSQFHGDVRIVAVIPDADGADTAWTRNAGANDFEAVDELEPDDDATYLESATATDESTIEVPTGVLNDVEAVNLCVYAKQHDAPGDQRGLTLMVNSGGSDYDGSEESPTTSYKYYNKIWEADPDDSAAWDQAKIEAADFGIELTT